MRVRTEAKRDAIVQVASEVFRELGFEGASMVEIAARLGGSRATLYGYFSSKEELFVAVIHGTARKYFEPIFAALEQHGDDEDLERVLQGFGEKVVAGACSTEAIQARRAVIAESGRSDIGRLFFEAGPKKGVTQLAGFLELQMQKGRLRSADPTVAAIHLMSLLDSETVTPSLLGLQAPMSRRELRDTTRRALQTFLRGYGPDDRKAP